MSNNGLDFMDMHGHGDSLRRSVLDGAGFAYEHNSVSMILLIFKHDGQSGEL